MHLIKDFFFCIYSLQLWSDIEYMYLILVTFLCQHLKHIYVVDHFISFWLPGTAPSGLDPCMSSWECTLDLVIHWMSSDWSKSVPSRYLLILINLKCLEYLNSVYNFNLELYIRYLLVKIHWVAIQKASFNRVLVHSSNSTYLNFLKIFNPWSSLWPYQIWSLL